MRLSARGERGSALLPGHNAQVRNKKSAGLGPVECQRQPKTDRVPSGAQILVEFDNVIGNGVDLVAILNTAAVVRDHGDSSRWR